MAEPNSIPLRRPHFSTSRPARKKRAFSARPFFATILLVCAIAAVSLLLDARSTKAHQDASALVRRDAAVEDLEVCCLSLLTRH